VLPGRGVLLPAAARGQALGRAPEQAALPQWPLDRARVQAPVALVVCRVVRQVVRQVVARAGKAPRQWRWPKPKPSR
jgi:hypothetical protein